MDFRIWSDEHRQRLRRARRAAGHTQAECASLLRELGAEQASQAAVSEWETGRTSRPSATAYGAIRNYWEGVESQTGTTAPGRQAQSLDAVDGSLAASAGGLNDTDGTFGTLARSITLEPLLSPRQALMVDALIGRIGSGKPLSDTDLQASRLVMQVLGLPVEAAKPPLGEFEPQAESAPRSPS
jgi:transcriptional regulator with XRE-family HTH domain